MKNKYAIYDCNGAGVDVGKDNEFTRKAEAIKVAKDLNKHGDSYDCIVILYGKYATKACNNYSVVWKP